MNGVTAWLKWDLDLRHQSLHGVSILETSFLYFSGYTRNFFSLSLRLNVSKRTEENKLGQYPQGPLGGAHLEASVEQV